MMITINGTTYNTKLADAHLEEMIAFAQASGIPTDENGGYEVKFLDEDGNEQAVRVLA